MNASKVMELLDNVVASAKKAEGMTNAELATFLCENFGLDERIDSLKSTVIGEIQHRLTKCTLP